MSCPLPQEPELLSPFPARAEGVGWYLGCLRQRDLLSPFGTSLGFGSAQDPACPSGVRPRSQDIHGDLWGAFWSHPSFCSGVGWAPRGRAGRSKSTLYLGAQRETETLERQADRHTVGSDAWSTDRSGARARACVCEFLRNPAPGAVCVYVRPGHTCAGTLREEAPLSPACRLRSARLQKPSCKGGGVGNVCGSDQVGSVPLPLPASRSSELASLPGIQVGRGRGRRRRELERGEGRESGVAGARPASAR